MNRITPAASGAVHLASSARTDKAQSAHWTTLAYSAKSKFVGLKPTERLRDGNCSPYRCTLPSTWLVDFVQFAELSSPQGEGYKPTPHLKGQARARLVEVQSAKKQGRHHVSNHSGPEAEKELAKLPGAGKAHRARHCSLFDRSAGRFTVSILRKNRSAVAQEVGVHSGSVDGQHLLPHLVPCVASSAAWEGHTRLGGWVLRKMAKLRRALECANFVERDPA